MYGRRAGEDLSPDDRLDRKAVSGLSDGGLAIKLNRRRRMAVGSKLVRVCICEDYAPGALELHAPRPLCPVCRLWPVARRLASAGEQLYPG